MGALHFSQANWEQGCPVRHYWVRQWERHRGQSGRQNRRRDKKGFERKRRNRSGWEKHDLRQVSCWILTISYCWWPQKGFASVSVPSKPIFIRSCFWPCYPVTAPYLAIQNCSSARIKSSIPLVGGIRELFVLSELFTLEAKHSHPDSCIAINCCWSALLGGVMAVKCHTGCTLRAAW